MNASFSVDEEEFVLQFDYYDNNTKPLLNRARNIKILNTDNPDISIIKYEIVNVKRLGEIDRNSLVLHFKLSDSIMNKNVSFDSIYIDDRKYLIGIVNIKPLAKTINSDFEILRHSGLGSKLNVYRFEVLNTSSSNLQIEEILLNEFKKYADNIEIRINDMQVEGLFPIILEPDDKILVRINFNSSKEYSSYVFNPTLRYSSNKVEKFYNPMRASYFLKAEYELSN